MMVALTFPDGARREYPQNITGLEIAKGISPSLAKRTVAMALDGALAGHAGHHRPGDRERLLLRLLPQPAVHPGGLRRDREEDARDHRARQTLHQGGVVA